MHERPFLPKRSDQHRRMRHDPEWIALRVTAHEAPERRQQIRVQTRFGFVQHHERRRPRRQQRGDEEKITKGPVGQLCLRERPQQARLREVKLEVPAFHRHLHRRARKGVVDGNRECVRIPDLLDRAPGRREIVTIVRQHGRAHADLRAARG